MAALALVFQLRYRLADSSESDLSRFLKHGIE
jgi:hypothetical protein